MKILFYMFFFVCKMLNFPVRLIMGKNAKWYDNINSIG